MKDKKRNLVILIPSFFGGGAEKVISLLSPFFRERCNVKIVTMERDIDYDFPQGVEYCFLTPLNALSNRFLKFLLFPLALLKFVRIIKEIRSDTIVFSLLFRTDLLNFFGSLFAQYKKITSIRTNLSSDFRNERNLLKRYIYPIIARFIYRNFNKIIAISEGVKLDIIKNLKVKNRNISVIYNPISLKEIKRLKKAPLGRFEAIFKKPVVLNIGRLELQKGQWHLVRSFKNVMNIYPDAILFIIGKGRLKKYLKRLISDLGLQNNVFIIGFQKNPYKFMFRANIYVSTSLWEGFGNTILEAMACGLPIISTDCKSGPREILAPGTDIEFETLTPERTRYGVLISNFQKRFLPSSYPLTNSERILSDVIIEQLYRKLNMKERKDLMDRTHDFSIEGIANKYLEIIEEVSLRY